MESSDESDDNDDGEIVTSPTTVRTKHDLMMKTEVSQSDCWLLAVRPQVHCLACRHEMPGVSHLKYV